MTGSVKRQFAILLLGGLLALLTTVAWAGTACTEKPLTPEGLANTSRLADKVFETLERSDAQVVILGREGADL